MKQSFNTSVICLPVTWLDVSETWSFYKILQIPQTTNVTNATVKETTTCQIKEASMVDTRIN